MSDIDEIKTSIKELADAREEKERKLKEAVMLVTENRRKQTGQ